MSITLRPYRRGGWEVDITLRLPNGSQHRERKRASHFSKSAAQRWAQDRERYLLQHGPPIPEKEVPTVETFAPRFVDGHPRANRQKPSGIAATESIVKWHLLPPHGAVGWGCRTSARRDRRDRMGRRGCARRVGSPSSGRTGAVTSPSRKAGGRVDCP
jgi:hypothetical protein